MDRQITISGTNNVYIVESEYFIQYEAEIPFYVFRMIEEDGNHLTLTVPVGSVAENITDEDERHISFLRASSEHQIQQMITKMKNSKENPDVVNYG